MGVTNIFKDIKPDHVNLSYKALVKKHNITRVAIDISGVVHQHVKGGGVLTTDQRGNITNHITGILGMVKSLRQAGVMRIIAVFDNPKPNKWKSGEHIKRQAIHQKLKTRLKELDSDDESKTHRQTIKITPQMWEDTRYILYMLGVTFCVTPIDFEAEHLAAQLQADGIVDAIITNDSDCCVLFGGTIIRRDFKTHTWSIYTLKSILQKYNLTKDEMVDCCLYLGCDFTPGVRGIGFKTYMIKKDELKLDEKQCAIKEYVTGRVPEYQAWQGEYQLQNCINWLHTQRGYPLDIAKKYTADTPPHDVYPFSTKELFTPPTWSTPDVQHTHDADELSDLSDLSD